MKDLAKIVRPTTFIRSEKLRRELNLDVTIVSETFQHTGSFKFRAAYNLASRVPNNELLTVSSGNFGQALACAAEMLGKKCTVVMPATSAQVKIDAVISFGATVDLIDTKTVARTTRIAQLSEEMPNAYLASPYDDELVIEGNASLGNEILQHDFELIIAPVGGGGLISGCVKAAQDLDKRIEVIGAEPAMANDAARSLKAGKLLANEFEPQSLADGARTLSLGKLNWELISKHVGEIIEVSEENIARALKLYFTLANLKAEPTGALSLGAVLENPNKFKGKKIALIVSGGNVDPAIYGTLITS